MIVATDRQSTLQAEQTRCRTGAKYGCAIASFAVSRSYAAQRAVIANPNASFEHLCKRTWQLNDMMICQ